ncbi:hypothetical protein RUM44_002936 [Polyplax serrata]|uniref:Uncharacterized protein n=1 Tax=Polyplax serrata TaxID=468196 RepID=A0ABR1AX67_POLSC
MAERWAPGKTGPPKSSASTATGQKSIRKTWSGVFARETHQTSLSGMFQYVSSFQKSQSWSPPTQANPWAMRFGEGAPF